MREIILLKMGEVVLKGLNRPQFEHKLIKDATLRLSRFGEFKIYGLQSAVYCEPLGDADLDGAFNAARKIFGVNSVSRAVSCPKNIEDIAKTAISYTASLMSAARSFKVESKRADKRFPMTSIEISRYVGGELADAFPNTAVDVHDPELTVCVEIRDYEAFIHAGGVPGAGGLPFGTSGSAVSLLSGGIDSPVSTFMMARRGLKIIPVHFFSHPYTSQLAKEKVIELTRVLSEYCGRLKLEIVPFTRIQEEIRKNCPEAAFTIIMRRFMMRIAEKIAIYNGCGAVITGENLGQVASQTMEAMTVTEAACGLPVFRPLIGMDKREITENAVKIGTFGTSILPYEDCCTVFTPRRPKTKPRLDEIIEYEKKLNTAALCDEAFGGIEQFIIHNV